MQIQIDLSLQFTGAFNVGSGTAGGSLAQRPLLKDWRGLPYLPGSSLKGRLRHTCKQLAEGLKQASCADPRAEVMCPNGPSGDKPCPICRLFGSPAFPGPLVFSDLILAEPEFLTRNPPPTSLRYGVGISRYRRVAEDDLLYSTEVFLPGGPVIFKGSISGQIDEPDLGLLVAGLEMLATLGSGKTAGLGWFELDMTLIANLSATEAKTRWLASLTQP
jgi:CRISPR/Cas system CSM-associated protein Csm3 (group 7 of RAMP superfamily)